MVSVISWIYKLNKLTLNHWFHLGDPGSLYYIILKGTVDIIVPKEQTFEFTNEQLLRFAILHNNDILFKHDDPSKRIPLLEKIQKILKNPEKLDELEEKYQNEVNKDKKEYKIKVLTKVGEYPAGKSFGELALMHSQPRAASILVKEDCDFATLSKKDYNLIIDEPIK